MSLVSITDLKVAFQSQEQGKNQGVQVVHGVSFSIEPGETYALVGESGSGKSVTAMSIPGLLPYPAATHPSGSILFKGQELLGRKEEFLRSLRGSQIGLVFQEPMTALNPVHTIEKQVAEPLFVHMGLTPKQARSRVIDLLKLVGFSDGEERLGAYPHQLSGGQRQRVMIAMALACEPSLLIADEPTTALDVTIQAGVISLLKRLQTQLKMSLLLISHDLSMVGQLAHRVGVMEKGYLREQGNVTQVLKKPKHPYTQRLIEAEPTGAPAPVPATSLQLLQVEELTVTFSQKSPWFWEKDQKFCAVKNVSLHLKERETLGIVGESGSGKSTLVYAILRLLPSTGRIVYYGKSLDKMNMKTLRALRPQLQVIFQDPFSSLNPRFTVGDIVAEGLQVHTSMGSGEIKERVAKVLQSVGIDPEAVSRYPHEFSGGQRQRIAIARALILKPKILVLDEPTSALDRSIQKEIVELLRALQHSYGLSYLFISHDLKVVKALSHRIMVMKQGYIVESGETQNIMRSPQNPYTRSLIEAAFHGSL